MFRHVQTCSNMIKHDLKIIFNQKDFFKTLMDLKKKKFKLKTGAELQGSLEKTGHAENCLEKTRQSC
jgi:hypothetical protein